MRGHVTRGTCAGPHRRQGHCAQVRCVWALPCSSLARGRRGWDGTCVTTAGAPLDALHGAHGAFATPPRWPPSQACIVARNCSLSIHLHPASLFDCSGLAVAFQTHVPLDTAENIAHGWLTLVKRRHTQPAGTVFLLQHSTLLVPLSDLLTTSVVVMQKATPALLPHHRKKKAVHKTGGADDKKLQNVLKRLGVNSIPGEGHVLIVVRRTGKQVEQGGAETGEASCSMSADTAALYLVRVRTHR
eukprot:331392-Chlamydomonas_euryale.AAC.6